MNQFSPYVEVGIVFFIPFVRIDDSDRAIEIHLDVSKAIIPDGFECHFLTETLNNVFLEANKSGDVNSFIGAKYFVNAHDILTSFFKTRANKNTHKSTAN